MLVLSRKVGESLVVTAADGTEIRFRVVKAAGKRVKVSIEAPPSARVLRSEIADRPADRAA